MKNAKLILAVLSILVVTRAVSAAPEQMEIKKTENKAREEQAKEKLKTIHLSRISDPEARKAIREILNYLNLPAQQN